LPTAAECSSASARKSSNPDQFNLGLEDLEQAIAAGEAEQEKADPALREARSEKRRAGRDRYRSTCRGSKSSLNRKTPPARAAAVRCIVNQR
jgi:DNA invertase Pin-like site-specific DNA recombinase